MANTESNSIEQYLRGKVGFEVTDETLLSVLRDRDVTSGSDAGELDIRTKELLYADLCRWFLTAPSVSGSVEDANGVWKHKEGSSQYTAADKKHILAIANAIYSRYGEPLIPTNSRIKIYTRGIKLWRERK